MKLRPGVVVVAIAMGAAVVAFAACGSSAKSTSPTSTTTAAASLTTTPSSPTTTLSTSTTAGVVSTANFNSCSVVTQAEAASALGAPVTKGVLGNATVEGGLACVFYGPSAPTPRTPNVAQPDTVRVVEVKGADALRWFTDYQSKVRPQPITGYGRLAFYDGAASLNILKGNCYVRIAVAPAGAPPSLTDEEHLAAVILPKL